MKYILVFTLLFSFSFADEIKRIESIVKDISELRYQNESCQKELDIIKNKQIIKQPTEKIQNNKSSNNDVKYKQKIINLQIQIEIYKNRVKAKNKEIMELRNFKKSNNQIQKNEICKPVKFDNPNKFPKLVLKKEYIKKEYSKYVIRKTKPSTYRLINKANIYSSIDGKKIEAWKNGVSFTTNIKASKDGKDSWLRVTGFFVNGLWEKAQYSIWLKSKDAKKR